MLAVEGKQIAEAEMKAQQWHLETAIKTLEIITTNIILRNPTVHELCTYHLCMLIRLLRYTKVLKKTNGPSDVDILK